VRNSSLVEWFRAENNRS